MSVPYVLSYLYAEGVVSRFHQLGSHVSGPLAAGRARLPTRARRSLCRVSVRVLHYARPNCGFFHVDTRTLTVWGRGARYVRAALGTE